ncbi:UNVERIFIED_CONTAM: hypothetical protein FKN15_042201 [Acipenser sinensis]
MDNSSKSFSDEEKKQLQAQFEKHGLEGVAVMIRCKIESLQNVPLDIAVTGNSGTGKSRLINALMGRKKHEKGAAKTGATETTMKRQCYKHPTLPTVHLWDLPGVGTLNFPADKYLEEMEFKTYDFFIIVSGNRFRTEDANLFIAINKMGKQAYFVRSKIDVDVSTCELDEGNVEEELEKIRKYFEKSLKDAGINSCLFFLLSSVELHKYDFTKFKEAILNGLPSIKRDVFLLSLSNLTADAIQPKLQILKGQVWQYAMQSGLVGAIPVPGLSFACDIAIFVTALTYFRDSLGLDDKSLQRLSKVSGREFAALKAEVKNPFINDLSFNNVRELLASTSFATLLVADEMLDFIPIIGSIMGASMSCYAAYKVLNHFLDEFAMYAENVMKVAFEKP